MNNSHEESSIRLKRPRSSLACIRCRNKKVKCDFDQPTCGRCSLSKAACHYANLPRRVDGQAFDELNSHVDGLKGKMRDMQNELIRLKNNLSSAVVACNNQSDHQEQRSKVAWKLAWTPTGLRIDTTISNAADLYRALLNCISQLRINHHELITGNLLNSQPSTKRRKKNNYLVEHQFSFLRTQTHQNDSPLFDYLEHYHTCFLSYQIVDKEDFRRKYNNAGLESGSEALLIHSVNAWMTKHVSIYHSANSSKCSNPMTAGESDFKQARHLLKRHFDFSRPSTIHALLNLYMYQLNCEQSSLAYLYIGLAIRMAQDLKLHKKKTLPADPKEQEMQKRLWWSAYWLDLWAALESNRPTMVDDKDCDLDYPARLDYEDEATGDRIRFCVQSIELLKIRKDLAKDMPSSSIQSGGEVLLTTLSRLERLLTLWLDGLPIEFRYHEGMIKTGTFQDEARFILNIQYHATWIMLHKFFLSTHQQRETPVSVLSLDICTRSANLITEMLSLYAKQQHWCHFFYVLDGVLASVSIHELNALSSEEVAVDAQRQLIETANILRRSPLTYMERVNAIIQRIDDFFNEH
ncbi:MAG: fungal-specific transcription factor domain-containing protein, partial [Benjaminiella poitrasii]